MLHLLQPFTHSQSLLEMKSDHVCAKRKLWHLHFWQHLCFTKKKFWQHLHFAQRKFWQNLHFAQRKFWPWWMILPPVPEVPPGRSQWSTFLCRCPPHPARPRRPTLHSPPARWVWFSETQADSRLLYYYLIRETKMGPKKSNKKINSTV